MRVSLILSLTLAMLGQVAFAQTAPQAASQAGSQAAPPADQVPRVGVGAIARKLALDEAIQLALKNNLEIDVERTNVATANEALNFAKGFYDFRFTSGIQLESRTTPVASVLAAADGKLVEHSFVPNFSVHQPTTWRGLSLQVDFDNGRQSTTNPFTGLTPYFTSSLRAALALPLVRGASIDEPRTEIIVRRKQTDLAQNDLELRVIDVITRTQASYWDLVAALEDVEVESEGVRLAQEQLARNQRMIASGTLAPIELAASEAELQRRIDSLSSAVGTVTVAENELKKLVAPQREDPIWNDKILPTERRQMDPAITDLPAATKTALERRPELKTVSLLLDVNGAQSTLARNQTKPRVDLVASYINNGLAGTINTAPNPFAAVSAAQIERLNELSTIAGLPPLPDISFGGIPPNFVGGYGQTLANMVSGNYQTFSGGLLIEWNPRNRSAEANLAQTAIADRRLKLQRLQVEQNIEAEVRNALQGLQTAKQRIEATRAADRAAQEKLESELRLFQTGESTNFFVLTRQNEVLDARRRSVEATLLLNRATARLYQVIGTTLDVNRIVVK
jgi:outer membrane protein TolC